MARPRGKNRSKEEVRAAVLRYMAGDKVEAIANDMGVAQPTISYWMKKYGKLFGDAEGQKFKRRGRGRRMAEEPCDRDKEILNLYACGVPPAHLARVYGVKRQRAWSIIQAWLARGYQPPPPPWKVGQFLRSLDCDFKLTHIHDRTSGRANLVARKNKDGQWIYDDEGVVDPFLFFQGGQLVEILREASSAQMAPPK